MNKQNNKIHMRKILAKEAARIILENGIQDYGLAKRKAAQRHGVDSMSILPRNIEIENSILEWHNNVDKNNTIGHLVEMRCLALKIMGIVKDFSPRLVGSVYSGSASFNSPVEIHVFTDVIEDLIIILEKENLQFKNFQKRYQFHGKSRFNIPGFSFAIEDIVIHLMVFGKKSEHNPPLSPIDRRPMKGIGRIKLLSLMNKGI
ncbi:MAG: hypothetical protein CMQ51_01720 [Gammaproteobacteria bacterium]|nr:hypothetical protein [Gammaproteobacteria bacterium]